MCVKLNSKFDREMKVYYVTHYVPLVLKQGINIKPMCPSNPLELRNMTLHVLEVYLGA